MAMVWVLDLLHLQLQHCPFSPIEALIVSGRPFAISTDSACKKFIWIISYLRFGFSFALYVRMCSLASMWVSQQLSKTFLTVENLWCFHSFFFFSSSAPSTWLWKIVDPAYLSFYPVVYIIRKATRGTRSQTEGIWGSETAFAVY